MYFSKEQIEQSIKRLNELNLFFGTAFLAFKKSGLLVGTTKKLDFSQVLENILQTYYRPILDYNEFYMPFATNKNSKWRTKKSLNSTLQNMINNNFSFNAYFASCI